VRVITEVPAVWTPVLVKARSPFAETVEVPRSLAAVPDTLRFVTPVTVLPPRTRVPDVAERIPASVRVPAPVPSYVPPLTVIEEQDRVPVPWVRIPPEIVRVEVTPRLLFPIARTPAPTAAVLVAVTDVFRFVVPPVVLERLKKAVPL